MAAWLATPKLTEAQLATMNALCNALQAAPEDEATKDDAGLQSRIGSEFHDVFLTGCGNRRLQGMLASIKEYIDHYRLVTTARPGRASESLRDHQKILEAFERRDADAAEHHVRRHIVSAVRALTG